MLTRFEVRKLTRHPMIWLMMAFFLAVNCLLIYTSTAYMEKGLKSCHSDILSEKIDKSDFSMMTSVYDDLDMTSLEKTKIELSRIDPQGSYRSFIDYSYSRLNDRVKEIKEDGEYDQMIYPGAIFGLHNILYNKIFDKVLLEMMAMISICVLFLMDYERMGKCEDLVYATRSGRRLQLKKLFAGIGLGTAAGSVLQAATLVIYFSRVPYRGFWNTSISSAIAMEPRGVLKYPFITFIKMTFGQYLAATVIMGLLLVIIVGLLTGAIRLFLKNSYLAALVTIVLLMALLSLSGRQTGTWADLVTSMNPLTTHRYCGSWFMEDCLFNSFPAYNFISMGSQLAVTLLLLVIGYRVFRKRDVC